MTSKPFTFTGNRLELNYATSAPGTIRVELQTPDGTPMPGHRLADCDPIWGDRLDRPVTWHGVAALSPLRGQPIRLHIQMHDADIYSLQFPA